jgi:hypothetical protein
LAAVLMKILTDPQGMTEEKANGLVERAIAEEVEEVLRQKRSGLPIPPAGDRRALCDDDIAVRSGGHRARTIAARRRQSSSHAGIGTKNAD